MKVPQCYCECTQCLQHKWQSLSTYIPCAMQVPMAVRTTLKCHKACYMDAQISQSLCITSKSHSGENYILFILSKIFILFILIATNLLRTCSCTHLSFIHIYIYIHCTHWFNFQSAICFTIII